MSAFLKEMSREVQVRVESYKRERETLLKATARIAELDALIAEAEEEKESLDSRIPKEPVDDSRR